MKRILSLILAMSMLMLLAACGQRDVEQAPMRGVVEEQADNVVSQPDDSIYETQDATEAGNGGFVEVATEPVNVQSEAGAEVARSWKNNVLAADPLEVLCPKKELIYSVTFLDTTEDAPRNSYNLGKGATAMVKGWVEWIDGMADVYIAADGGINGKIACRDLFYGCDGMVEVNFNGAFHTDEAEDMMNMFRSCVSLEELDVSTLNTSKVKRMDKMFSTCSGLTELDLSSFDTSRVTSMELMFSACTSLESVEVAHFNTSRVTNMGSVFRWCNSLWDVDVSGWDVSRVRNYTGFMNDGMYINGEPWEEFFR